MDEKLRKNSFSVLNVSRRWVGMFAVSLFVMAPLAVSAEEFDNMGESISQAVQQDKKNITGTVLDENGQPAIGAFVAVKGTTQTGAITDVNGKFTISVRPGTPLVVSYIGYKSQTVTAKSGITIRLETDQKALEEVVVIGYGTAKKKDLTGSISQIDNKLIDAQNQSSATKVLEGAVPGITYASVDAQPGNDAALRLRGIGSTTVNASSALIIIDGVPAQGDNPLSNMNPQDIATMTVLKDAASTAIYGSRGANGVILVTTKSGQQGKTKISFQGRWGVNTVGTYDVGQIDDAAGIYEYMWQSIYNSYRYGVNGTGGPILNTATGEYMTNVKNPNYSHEQAAEFASAHLFNYIGKENSFARNNLGNYMAYAVPGAIYTPDGTGSSHSSTMSGAYLVGVDGKLNPNAQLLYRDTYKDVLLKNQLRQEYNVSANGGTEKVNYFMSLGYLKDPSYIPNSNFERFSGRSKLDAQLFSWLKMGMNVAYTRTTTNYMGTYWQGRNSGSNQGSVMRFVNGHTPIIPVYARDENGNVIMDESGSPVMNTYANRTYSPLGETGNNYGNTDILYAINHDKRTDVTSTLNTRIYAEIPFLQHFTFRTDLAYDKINIMNTRYFNGYTGRAMSMGGYFGKRAYDTQVINLQHRLTYTQDFGQHHVDALALYEESDWRQETVSWGSSDELIEGFLGAGNFVGRYQGAGSAPSPGYGKDIERMRSWLGRVNYIFNEKYYASASIRTDGSSKFKKERWGTFWSVGAGWRFSEEKFMEDMKSWLDNGKLRASYGVTGNQNAIGRYSGYRTWGYSTVYQSTTNGTGKPTGQDYKVNPGGLVNDALTWETTNVLDIGLDLSLFNRVNITLDWYNRITDNSFFNQPVSYLAVGQSSLQQNVAKLQNQGIEVDINADIIRTKDWRWNVAFNASHYTTKLKDLPESAIPATVTGLPEGTWQANCDGWSVSGDVAQSSPFYLRGVGRDWYNIYIYKYAGIEQETGLPLYYRRADASDVTAGKASKEGEVITTNNYAKASRFEVGSAIPDVVGGFNTSVSYKEWSLTAAFAYQIGGKFFDMQYAEYLYSPTTAQHYRMMFVSKDVQGNTWRTDRTGAEFPMQWYPTDINCYFDGTSANGGNWNYTDRALFDASYLRIKNVTLNYTVPKSFLRSIKLDCISNLRLFASADNLAIFSAHKGVDPSTSASGGYSVGSYGFPNIRSYTFGINLDF